MTSTDIREGFICPICLKDFSSVTLLQAHFEDAHTTEERAVSQQLKGLFEKAKKRLLGDVLGDRDRDREELSEEKDSQSFSNLPGLDPSFWEPQEFGTARSHTDTFKAIRDSRSDRFVVETNKLLIRLDKLISQEVPAEPTKRKNVFSVENATDVINKIYSLPQLFSRHRSRLSLDSNSTKAFEKTVVPWVNDADVPMCPTCARTFTVTRRRHHCRLCGGIACDRCSHFMSFSFAKKLTDPAYHNSKESGFLKRSGSDTSLNSMFSAEGEQQIRTCLDCRRLLERRDELVEQRNTKPPIVQLYEKLKICIEQAEEQLPRFLPMVESLSVGDSTYSLNQASHLRSQLLKLYEYIDILSKKILVLGLNDELPPPQRQLYLQRAIRNYSSNFLRENMSGIQQLPSEEEYNKMQESHSLEMQQKFALERQAAMVAQEQVQRRPSVDSQTYSRQHHAQPQPQQQQLSPLSQSRDGYTRTESNGSIGKGWTPSETSPYVKNTNDPMLQQMEIIRGYIKQAKQAHKMDEVEMLENNLRELQLEYRKQQS